MLFFALQQPLQLFLHLLHLAELVGDFLGSLAQLQKLIAGLLGAAPAYLCLGQFLLQAPLQLGPQAIDLIQGFQGQILTFFNVFRFDRDALLQQHADAREYGGGHELTKGQGPQAAGMQPIFDLAAAVPSRFAPVGEVLAVIEEQIVILLPQPSHGAAQGHPGGRTAVFWIADHCNLLTPAKVLAGAAQNFPSLQVVGHGAISQVDAVVVEQAVLPGGLEMVGGGQGRCGGTQVPSFAPGNLSASRADGGIARLLRRSPVRPGRLAPGKPPWPCCAAPPALG